MEMDEHWPRGSVGQGYSGPLGLHQSKTSASPGMANRSAVGVFPRADVAVGSPPTRQLLLDQQRAACPAWRSTRLLAERRLTSCISLALFAAGLSSKVYLR